MCRKHQTAGACLISAGVGIVVGLVIGSGAAAVILALALLAAGAMILRKR